MLNRKIAYVVPVLLIVAGIGAYQYVERSRQLPEGLIQANGRIEGDTIIIASKQPGKIVSIHVEEGDDVAGDQLLIELDDKSTRAKLAEVEATKLAAHAQAQQCRAEYDVLKAEMPLGVDSARAGVAASESRLEQSLSEERQAKKERNRYWSLAEKNSVEWETAERADLRWQQAQDQVLAVRAERKQAFDALKDSQLGPIRLKAKALQAGALDAAADAAQARIEEVRSVLQDLTILAPAPGTVTMRVADLGEVVNSGMPLLQLVDLDRLYLKVFVPEIDIGKVRIGLPVQVYIDAYPEMPFAAEVRSIAARAEFTPKEIQTPDERVKLVYAVKLYFLENPDHRLVPGLPADAVIRWQEDAPWAKPRW